MFERGKCCFQGWSTGILGFITLFRKVASHVGLIYPGSFEQWFLSLYPAESKLKLYLAATIDRTDRADIFERVGFISILFPNGAKADLHIFLQSRQDLVHIKMAFPLDYQTRMYGSMVAHDETLCGKWTVRRSFASLFTCASFHV